MHPKDDEAEYILELTKRQGVSVTTVKDGWVCVFTQAHLELLLQQSKDSGAGQVAVFVQDSSKVPATQKN